MPSDTLIKRNPVFDIAKGIGIILVVFGHLTHDVGNLRIIIYSFHMPLFFFISGYLYKHKNFKTTFKHGLKKFILPAYVFVIIDLLISLLLNAVHGETLITGKEFLHAVLINGGPIINTPIWFLPALFACNLLHCLVNDKKYLSYFTVAICFLISIFQIFHNHRMYWFIAVFACYVFYFAGFVFKSIDIHKYEVRIPLCILIFAAELVIMSLIALYNGYIDINYVVYGKSYALLFLTGLIGTDAVLIFSYLIDKTKLKEIPLFLGKHSFFIFITHYYICKRIVPKALELVNLQELGEKLYFQIIASVLIVAVYYIILKLYFKFKQKKFLEQVL